MHGAARLTSMRRIGTTDMKANAYAFYKKIRQYIERYHMLVPGDGVVAGVSGGADSMCLLQVLCALREEFTLRLAAVHVHHGIRGEAADGDEAFVRAECEKRGVFFRAVHADVPELAARWSCSEEEAGRRVRYAAFREAAAEFGYGKIAVAHNENDNAETFLFQAFRGSGLWGLAGIAPCRIEGSCGNCPGAGIPDDAAPAELADLSGAAPVIIRPLLCVSRAQIEEYLAEEGVTFRTDATNFTGDYARNRIRNELLPLAERAVNAGAVEHLAKTAAEVYELSEYVREMTEESYRRVAREKFAEESCRRAACGEFAEKNCRQDAPGAAGGSSCMHSDSSKSDPVQCGTAPAEICVDIPVWKALPGFMQKEVVLYVLGRAAGSRRDIGRVHVEAVCDLMRGETGRSVNLPYGLLAIRSYDVLRIVQEHAEASNAMPRLALGSCVAITSFPASFTLGGYELTLRLKERSAGEAYSVQPAPRTENVLPDCDENEKNSLIPKNCYTKWFDYDKIGDTLVLRTRRAGDYIVIQKDGGKKSLKSLLIDKKIQRECRETLPVLAAGSRVLWAVGVRGEEGLYVSENTKQILVAELKKRKG